MNLLIVEDEWLVSEEIKESLIQNGFHVVGQTDNAEAALSMLEETKVDLILMDIDINGNLDGISLAKLILQNCQCFIIFLSSLRDKAQKMELDEIMNCDYLPKPFTIEGLYRVFKKHKLSSS